MTIRRLTTVFGTALVLGMAGAWAGQVWAAEGNNQPAAAPAADAKAAGGGDAGKEVVIRGESRLKVKIEKPEPDLKFDVDEIAVPYVKTEDYVMDVSPTAIAHPPVLIASYLSSSQTASPFVQIFKRPPIMSLHPHFKSKGNIARWRLRITDGFGNVFKDFGGKNNLPDEIVWDGHGGTNDKDMADVGISYSYIFSIVDEASNPTSQMGHPVNLESLLYEENNALTAKVLADVLFEKKDRKLVLSRKGELYCREIADMLFARQNYPLLIDSYAKDEDAAVSNGEIIQDFLAERYVLPKDRVKISGNKSRLEKIVFTLR